ncbi:MAG: hypothetical protein AB1486_07660 [Planctomycetota bacterium]
MISSVEKLDFYARIGVAEVLVIDVATKRPQVFTRTGPRMALVRPSSEGWPSCEALGLEFRGEEREGEPCLCIREVGAAETIACL